MTLAPADIEEAIDDIHAPSKNGLRYPVPQCGIQQDVRARMGVSCVKVR